MTEQQLRTEPHPRAPRRSSAPSVLAVLVIHDGMKWLGQCCDGIEAQGDLIQRLVVIDTDSRDASRDQVESRFPNATTITLDRKAGLHEAVTAALTAATEAGDDPAWIWLLHDDCAPQPGALDALLTVGESDPLIAVVGPKVVGWDDPTRLLEAGVSIDPSGSRVTGLDPGEIDQGQLDTDRQVLAVGTVAMLIRVSTWNRLGGFDPKLPIVGTNLDYGWRVTRLGQRVVVAPDAVVRHIAAIRRWQRRPETGARRPHRAARAAGLYTLLVNTPLLISIAMAIRATLAMVIRFIVYMLARHPGYAIDELVAWASVLGRPWLVLAGRKERRRSLIADYYSVRILRSRPRERMRRALENTRSVLGSWFGGLADLRGPELSEDEQDRPWTRHPMLYLFGLLLIITVIAERDLIFSGQVLAGGRLLPGNLGASDLWSMYLGAWHPNGIGSAAAAPPYLALLAIASTILAGKVWLALEILMLFMIPIAGVLAFKASAVVSTRRDLRFWAAATYALLPVATGTISGGRFDVAATIILLPPAVAAVVRFAQQPFWWRALAAGVMVALVSVFAPILFLVSIPALPLAAWVGAARRHESIVRPLLLSGAAILVTPLMLFPWIPAIIDAPGILIHGPGPVIATSGADGIELALLWPGGPGLPWLVVLAPLVIFAAIGLGRRRRMAAIVCWSIALAGFVLAFIMTRVTTDQYHGGIEAPGWAGVGLTLAAVGLLSCVIMTFEGGRSALSTHLFSWRQPALLAFAAIVALVPVALAAVFVVRATPGPLSRGEVTTVPVFITIEQQTATRPAVLVLRPRDSGAEYTVERADPVSFGMSDLPPAGADVARFDTAVTDLIGGYGSGAAQTLARYGIRYVYLPSADGAGAQIRDTLNSSDGLGSVSTADAGLLWKLQQPAGRLRIIDPGRADQLLAAGETGTAVTVPAGADGRQILLSEPASAGWRAAINGTPLTRTTIDGQQGWSGVPIGGGRLVIHYDNGSRPLMLWVQLIVVLGLLLALPGRHARAEDAAARLMRAQAEVPSRAPQTHRTGRGRPGRGRR